MTPDPADQPREASGADEVWGTRFPGLFEERALDFGGVGYPHLTLAFSLATPPDDLVGNVRIIGQSDGRVVVCGNDLGWRFLPGGTREPGEHPLRTAERELLEEAGAVFTGPIIPFGAFLVHNSAAPYRPHLPHTYSYWLYVTGEVSVLHPPTNPVDGETVTEVRQLPPTDAIDYLEASDETTMAAVLRLFLEITSSRSPPTTDGIA